MLLNNRAIADERDRLVRVAEPSVSKSCAKAGCVNSDRGVAQHPEAYQRFGRTTSGSQRYRCRACGSVLSVATTSRHRLRRPEKTLEIFKGLINKVPMRRLCDLADVRPATLYQRIGLIYERCRDFAAAHEESLKAGRIQRKLMHIVVDRQEHTINSSTALDPRPTALLATASAEAGTGYILAQHLNFDPDADAFEEELVAREAGDLDQPAAFRAYGRLWLPYQRMTGDNAVAGDPADLDDCRPANRGAQVHSQISLAAHIQVIARMAQGADRVQLSMDRESGIERLSLLAFADRVRAGTLDAFLVRIEKNYTQAQKRQALAEAETALREACRLRSTMSEVDVLFDLIGERYSLALRTIPDARNRWVTHPYPNMTEPERAILCLTDNGAGPRAPVVAGFARASLRSIDRYFMQVRRKIHLLERPLATSGALFRRWYGYSAYNPVVVMKLLEIFRTVYNYHLVGRQKTTPAQRLTLAERPVALAELTG